MTAASVRRGESPQHNRENVRSPDACARSLAAYLRSVRDELTRRQVRIVRSRVQTPGPRQALCASIELRPPGSDASRAVRAGWHEELGWWAQPASPSPGSVRARRYLPGDLTPGHVAVAGFLMHSSELGSVEPTLWRNPLLASDDHLIEALTLGPDGGAH